MSGMAEQPASAGLSFNPWDENFRRNPYSFYQPLRMSPPPVLRFFIPVAIISRYADVLATLRDQIRFSSMPVRNRMTIETTEVFGDAPSIVSSDPPIHTRMRKLVSRDFTPARDPRVGTARAARSPMRCSTRLRKSATSIWSRISRFRCRSESSPAFSASPASITKPSSAGRIR